MDPNPVSSLDKELDALKLEDKMTDEKCTMELEPGDAEPQYEPLSMSTINEESESFLAKEMEGLASCVENKDKKPVMESGFAESLPNEDGCIGNVDLKLTDNQLVDSQPSPKDDKIVSSSSSFVKDDVCDMDKMDKQEADNKNSEVPLIMSNVEIEKVEPDQKLDCPLLNENEGTQIIDKQKDDKESTDKGSASAIASSSAPTESEFDPIFEKCKSLAMNKESHLIFLQDDFLTNFLIFQIASDEPKLAFRSLEIFNLFASASDETRIALGNRPYFFEGIRAAAENKALGDEICDFANSIYLKVKETHQNRNKSKTAKKRALGTSSVHNESRESETTTKGTPQSKSHNWKQMYYYVPECIFKAKRVIITGEILKLRGILAITYDLRRTYLVLRTKKSVSKDLIGETITKLGFHAKFVERKEAEKAVMLAPPTPAAPILTDSKLGVGAFDQTGFDFLDEEVDDGSAVAKVDNDKENTKANNWFGAAKDMFQKSFFW